MTRGVLVFRGEFGGTKKNHYLTSSFDNLIGTTELNTLVTALATHTDANIAFKTILSRFEENDAEGTGANVDRKAIIYFRHPTTLKVHSLTVPAPVAADVEDTDQGERVKASAVTTIVGLINAATGISYAALHGVVIQDR